MDSSVASPARSREVGTGIETLACPRDAVICSPFGASRAIWAAAPGAPSDWSSVPPVKKHVLILGGGFGGLELATRLSETIPDAVRVTLLDRNDAFFFGYSK